MVTKRRRNVMGIMESMNDMKNKAKQTDIDDKAMEKLKKMRHKNKDEQGDKD
jgi:hypothetical protein